LNPNSTPAKSVQVVPPTRPKYRLKMSITFDPTDCASKVSLSLLFYICIYCFYLVFFIIIDVLFSNEVSFNVSIGFWSLNELFQKIQSRNSEQRIEEKFS